ncbi:HNH endonuclease [Frisingicoccus sp.]|uniref:HNH endonuclease n=1 Tax=Frisingicoccus sp. TaxID=1918627 RepID=UPI003AB1BD37
MEWLIAANRNMYNHVRAFKELPYVDWKQTNNYSVGDKVYIYSAMPIQAIEFLVEVIKTDITVENVLDDKEYWSDIQEYENGRNNGKYVRFKLINYFEDDAITFSELHENGLEGNIQGARKLYSTDNSIKNWGNYIHKRLKNIDEKYIWKKNTQLDLDLEEKIASVNIDAEKNYHYNDKVNPKPIPIEGKGKKIYKRNKDIAINALGIAQFRCEIDDEHYTFLRRNTNIPYTEPHHLIPMAYQEEFNYSIDIEENIVSLCSNCHNEIHYGKDAEYLIVKLYNKRKNLLAKKKIVVSLEKLLSYYGL